MRVILLLGWAVAASSRCYGQGRESRAVTTEPERGDITGSIRLSLVWLPTNNLSHRE